ncbi:sodium:proton antiporter [Actinoallomurus acaciae]|uniref:Sodium:proton antiporter n=1 Tax=Actinoallomurus acaciae TaxID=502577 RepID=A0ABV5YU33_9ACTN
MTAAIAVGVLVAGGVFLILRSDPVRVVFGFVLLGHAVNLFLTASGGLVRRAAPLVGRSDPARMADPLPQAFVLTAVVITFGITMYLLGLVRADPPAAEPEEERSGDGPAAAE